MILPIIDRLRKKDQRGGIAILTALGFLLFSVPLITGSLNVAQNTSIDSRVKTNIAHEQYCGLAVQEYLNYLLLDNTRWNTWLAENVDPEDPSGLTSTETVEPCGRNITITVSQQLVVPPGSTSDPLGNPLSVIPQVSAYNNRDFHVTKTVSDPNPNGGDSVTYTITIVNRDDTNTVLTNIEDNLPPGFTYDCDAPANQLTLPESAPQVIVPHDIDDLCEEDDDGDDDDDDDDVEIDWRLPSNTSIPPGGVVTLTFSALANSNNGTFCNEAQVNPGGNKTKSGKVAIVQIGANPGLCSDDATVISKTVESVEYVSTDSGTSPLTYTFDIDYTIKIDNIGTDWLWIDDIIDLLPEGFSYVSTSSSGDITTSPSQLKDISQLNRQEVTWSPSLLFIAPGSSNTLVFSTIATVPQGNYFSDILIDFHGSFSEDTYSWPTALVSVKDVFTVVATDDDGNEVVVTLQVWTGDEDGVISIWDLN